MLFKKQIISIKSKPMQMLPYPGKQRESLKKLFPFVKMGEGAVFHLRVISYAQVENVCFNKA